MGKLVEKLHQVGQTTGNRFGFMGRAEAETHPPRPAALLVALGAGDTATAEASIKAGADGFLITDWSPNSDIDRMKATSQPGGTLWGVEYAGAPGHAGGSAEGSGRGRSRVSTDWPIRPRRRALR